MVLVLLVLLVLKAVTSEVQLDLFYVEPAGDQFGSIFPVSLVQCILAESEFSPVSELVELIVVASHCGSLIPTAFSPVEKMAPDVVLVIVWACWLLSHLFWVKLVGCFAVSLLLSLWDHWDQCNVLSQK